MDQIRIVRQALLNRDWNERLKDSSRLYDQILYLDGRQNQPEDVAAPVTLV